MSELTNLEQQRVARDTLHGRHQQEGDLVALRHLLLTVLEVGLDVLLLGELGEQLDASLVVGVVLAVDLEERQLRATAPCNNTRCVSR